jgi:hypothetical protein
VCGESKLHENKKKVDGGSVYGGVAKDFVQLPSLDDTKHDEHRHDLDAWSCTTMPAAANLSLLILRDQGTRAAHVSEDPRLAPSHTVSVF